MAFTLLQFLQPALLLLLVCSSMFWLVSIWCRNALCLADPCIGPELSLEIPQLAYLPLFYFLKKQDGRIAFWEPGFEGLKHLESEWRKFHPSLSPIQVCSRHHKVSLSGPDFDPQSNLQTKLCKTQSTLFIRSVLLHRAQPFLLLYTLSFLLILTCTLQDHRHMSPPTEWP